MAQASAVFKFTEHCRCILQSDWLEAFVSSSITAVLTVIQMKGYIFAPVLKHHRFYRKSLNVS